MKRIGISMRISHEINYVEQRDSLATNWSNFFIKNLQKYQFIYLPNIENHVSDYLDFWNVDVILLSGGDDIGKDPQRDKTESLLIKHAIKYRIPIIGICRGMQLIHTYFGGKLFAGDEHFRNEHVNKNHNIKTIDNMIFEVNSFHSNYIARETLNEKFKILAETISGHNIEAIISKDALGIMWHPERNISESSLNYSVKLMKEFISNYE